MKFLEWLRCACSGLVFRIVHLVTCRKSENAWIDGDGMWGGIQMRYVIYVQFVIHGKSGVQKEKGCDLKSSAENINHLSHIAAVFTSNYLVMPVLKWNTVQRLFWRHRCEMLFFFFFSVKIKSCTGGTIGSKVPIGYSISSQCDFLEKKSFLCHFLISLHLSAVCCCALDWNIPSRYIMLKISALKSGETHFPFLLVDSNNEYL